MANIPGAIVLPQGGGGNDQSFVEQLVLTLASQAPNMLMGHLARKDEQRTLQAKNEAAMPAIQQLMAAAANDPTLAPLAQSIGAFWQQAPDVQSRSAADFLGQSTNLMTSLQDRQTSIAAAEQAKAAARASNAMTETENSLRSFRQRQEGAKATTAEVEADWAQYFSELDARAKETEIELMGAQTTEALSRAQQASQARLDGRIALAAELEALERETINGQLETWTGMQMGPAQARLMTALTLYGTPELPSNEMIRADAQARAAGGQSNMFAKIRERLLAGAAAAGLPLTPQVADELDKALLLLNGDGDAVMKHIVESKQVPPAELPAAALYLSAATRSRVNVPEPVEPGRLKVFIERLMQGMSGGGAIGENVSPTGGVTP